MAPASPSTPPQPPGRPLTAVPANKRRGDAQQEDAAKRDERGTAQPPAVDFAQQAHPGEDDQGQEQRRRGAEQQEQQIARISADRAEPVGRRAARGGGQAGIDAG